MRECRTCFAQIDPARFEHHMRWHGRIELFVRSVNITIDDLKKHRHIEHPTKFRYWGWGRSKKL